MLQQGIEYCQSFYLLYKNQSVPQERLDLLIRWISDAQRMLAPPIMPQQLPATNQQDLAGMALPNSQIPDMTAPPTGAIGM